MNIQRLQKPIINNFFRIGKKCTRIKEGGNDGIIIRNYFSLCFMFDITIKYIIVK